MSTKERERLRRNIAHKAHERVRRWDPEFGESVRSEACDCGAVKGYGREACEACLYLDGTDKRGELISYMRSMGEPVTIREVYEALGRDPAAVHRAMKALVRSGRARERQIEINYQHRVNVMGRGQMVDAMIPRVTNVYALTTRRKRA